MKTLEEYIVVGGLLYGGSGVPAQVGDQVKLYLDTEAIPEFPEFINGVIQHPIETVQCGNAVSYSIEYDEADLLGAINFLRPDDVISAELITLPQILSEQVAEIYEIITPLQLTEPPVDEAYTLQTAFAGINNDLLFTWTGSGIVPQVVFSVTPNGFPAAAGVAWNSTTRVLTVSPADNGTNVTSTASSLIPIIQNALLSTPELTVALASGDNGTGIVAAMALTPLAQSGDIALRAGQHAIVTVTNGGRTYQDVWTATQIDPTKWAHPEGLVRDRGNADRLMRGYVDVDNSWGWEVAYL